MKVNDYKFWKGRIESAPDDSTGAFDKFVQDSRPMDQEPRNMYVAGGVIKVAKKFLTKTPKPKLTTVKPSILRREAVALDLNQINSISKNKEFEQAWKNYKISIKDVGRRKYGKDQFFEMWARENMADGGRMLNPVQMGEDRGDRTGFRKPIYVPTKESYVVNDRTNNLIEDFKIEDYGSKSEAKKAADALDKKISTENKQRQLKISEKNRADFSNKRINFKKSINTWTQEWMDNNIKNYDLKDADTFIKDMKLDFAEDFNIEAPTKNTAASIEGFPNIGTDAKGGKAAFTPYGIDSIKKAGKSKTGSSYYDSFFRRAFLTNKIQTDDVLKGRISSYLDYATINKPGGSLALDKLKLKYADTLNNLDDVMYVLSDDTQVVNLAKKNLLSNIFPQYNKFREKKNASAISRKINIAKIEKTLGPAKLKELLNGGTSINKFLVDEGKTLKEFFPSMKELPLGLRYSIDHNIGIAELAKLSKLDMEKGLSSLIGMSNKRNYDLGWKGYSVIKKNLINKIQQGNDVSGNLNKLNKITQTAYGSELKGKKAYDLVDGKLTFTEDFTFTTNPEERFKSYFEEINKTKKGKIAIKKDFGSMKKTSKALFSFMKRNDIKCSLSNGVDCGRPEAYVKSINELKAKAAAGDKKAAEQLIKVTKGMSKGGKLLRSLIGPGAILFEPVYEGTIMANKVLDGKPLNQAWAESYLSYLDSERVDPKTLEREEMLYRQIEGPERKVKGGQGTVRDMINIDGGGASKLRPLFAAEDTMSAFEQAKKDKRKGEFIDRKDIENRAAADIRDMRKTGSVNFAQQRISDPATQEALSKAQEYIAAKRGGNKVSAQSAQADSMRSTKAMTKMRDLFPTTYENFKPINTPKKVYDDYFIKEGLMSQDQQLTNKYYQNEFAIPEKFEQLMKQPGFKGTQDKFAGGGLASLKKKYYD